MLRLITAATTKAVSEQKVKDRLRIETSDDNADLNLLISAATLAVESSTHLILQPSTWEYRFENWPCWLAVRERFDGTPVWPWPALQIPAFPVRDITALKYLDADGAEQTVDAANYNWERTSEGADIAFVSGFSFPTLGSYLQPVRVVFEAGFNDPEASGSGVEPELTLPPTAEMAVMFLIGHWHRTRQPTGKDQPFVIPQTFEWLAAQLKVYR